MFGNHKSILKPSTLFSDANVSTPSVTFGNNTTKSVKLKPSVLANPFVNSKLRVHSAKGSLSRLLYPTFLCVTVSDEPDKQEEVKVNCDEKNEEVLPDNGDEASLSKDVSSGNSTVFERETTEQYAVICMYRFRKL